VTLDSAVLKVGSAVGRKVVTSWLNDRTRKTRRGSDLSRLIVAKLPEIRRQREFRREIELIEEEVAERLKPLVAHEYRSMSENDRTAVLILVADCIALSDLSDSVLYDLDMRASALSDRISTESADRLREATLGESGEQFFSAMLRACCWMIMNLVRELPEFSAVTAIETLRRCGDIVRTLDSIKLLQSAVTLDAPAGVTLDADFRSRYLRYISDSRDKLDLFGVVTKRFRPKLPLSLAYISLRTNIPQIEELLGLRWYVTESSGIPAREENVRVEDALAAQRRTFIRAEAGSGKTTLLDWLAVSVARGSLSGGLAAWRGLVPFFIRLRSFAQVDLPKPESFVRANAEWLAGLEPQAWSHRCLDDENALVLVDGVDELPSGRRNDIREWIEGLLDAYPKVRVVVTSRPNAAAADWLEDLDFSTLTLERMTLADVRKFVQHWYRAAVSADHLPCEVAELPAFERRLLADLESRPDLRALATNPLLCALLCALNLDRVTTLPDDRLSVYDLALDMLLERREADRKLNVVISARDARVLLQEIAWRLSINNRSEITSQAVERVIERRTNLMPNASFKSAVALRYLIDRTGVLREPSVGRIDFVHRSFQEYLTAAESAEEDYVGALIERAHQDQWRDIIIMACGRLNRPQRNDLLGGILDRAGREKRHRRKLKFLAVACLETTRDVPLELMARIDECAKDFIPPRNESSVDAISGIGSRILHYVPPVLDGLSISQAVATVRTLARLGTREACMQLKNYASDERPRVHREIVSSWKYFDPELYAREVLAEIDFNSAAVELSDPRLARFVNLLPSAGGVDLTLTNEVYRDLSCIDGLRVVNRVFMNIHGTVSLQPLLQHQELVAVGFAGPAVLVDLDVLASLRNLTQVSLFNRQKWRNIDFVEHLPSTLTRLIVASLEDVQDFRPLNSLRHLEDLTLHDCSPEFDFEVLRPVGANLRSLGLTVVADTPEFPSDFDIIFPRLNEITLNMAKVPYLMLSRLQSLTSIWISVIEESDLDFSLLSKLPNLADLTILTTLGSIDLKAFCDRPIRLTVRKGCEVINAGANINVRRV